MNSDREHVEIVAYHTGGPYRTEAEIMRQSLDDLGIPATVIEVADRGAWTWNTHAKADFICERLQIAMLDETAIGMLCVDVDTVFHSDPRAFMAALDCDFAAAWIKDRELLSGTLFFACSDAALALAEQWRAVNARRPRKPDGPNLQAALAELAGLVRCLKLPPQYTFIFDTFRTLYPGVSPIIEHMQASRRLRNDDAMRHHRNPQPKRTESMEQTSKAETGCV